MNKQQDEQHPAKQQSDEETQSMSSEFDPSATMHLPPPNFRERLRAAAQQSGNDDTKSKQAPNPGAEQTTHKTPAPVPGKAKESIKSGEKNTTTQSGKK